MLQIDLMVNERSFVETDRRPSIADRLDSSNSFCGPRPRGKIRSDGRQLHYLVAYIDTNHRLPSGSPSGFLVAVRQSPTATAASLSALRPLFLSEAGTPDGQPIAKGASHTHIYDTRNHICFYVCFYEDDEVVGFPFL